MLSKYIKSKILSYYTSFPFDGEVFDYTINWQAKEFQPWTKQLQPF